MSCDTEDLRCIGKYAIIIKNPNGIGDDCSGILVSILYSVLSLHPSANDAKKRRPAGKKQEKKETEPDVKRNSEEIYRKKVRYNVL